MDKYVLIAGVNGSGKSTLYQTLYSLHDMPRVNTDEIVRSFGTWNNASDLIKASKQAIRMVSNYLDNHITFNQETTLCGRSILNNIKKAKNLGYFIEMYYIGVSGADTAIERVKKRVNSGGHGIPSDDIRRRYIESLNNLVALIPICDRIFLYDNEIDFKMFAFYRNGKLEKLGEFPDWFLSVYKQC